jgi:hypothetical protein
MGLKWNKVMAIFLSSVFILSGMVTVTLIREQWSIVIGGAGWDGAYSIGLTSDGGYIVAGGTDSYGSGGVDAWLIRIDSSGQLLWNKTYGGAGDDEAYSVQQTSDGGYVFSGQTSFYDFRGPWIVKVDPNGNIVWSKAYWDETGARFASVQQSSDGGYVIAGHRSGSVYYPVSHPWIMKLDSQGEMLWNKTFDDLEGFELESIVQTNDGGYVAAGRGYGALVIKVDSEGNTLWKKSYVANNTSLRAFCIQQISSGGYVVAGDYYVKNDSDFWLSKIDLDGNLQWSKTYGGVDTDTALCVREKSDGGYAVIGYTFSSEHVHAQALLVYTDEAGNAQTILSIGGESDDYAYSMVQTPDGRFVLAGTTYSSGNWGQVWVAKV